MIPLALVARPGHSTRPPAVCPGPLSVRGENATRRAPPAWASVAQRRSGVYRCPFGFALNVTLRGDHRLVPVTAKTPVALAPLAAALKLVRRSGGFEGQGSRLPTAEIRMLFERVPDLSGATRRIRAAGADLLAAGLPGPGEHAPRCVQVALELRSATDDALAVHLSVDGTSPEHERLLKRVAARLRPALGGLIEASARSELHDVVRRRVLARCRVEVAEIIARLPRRAQRSPARALEAIRRALSWLAAAEDDAALAAAQNEVVLADVANVAEALGRDRQRILVEGRCHASRFGRAAPLAVFRLEGEHLVGALELPLGIDWSERRHDHEADLANALLRGQSVETVGLLSACLGLAAHLATLERVIPLAFDSAPRARSLPPPPPRRAPDDSGVHRAMHRRRSLPPPLPRHRECG